MADALTLYHGTLSTLEIHEGLCLTDDEGAASSYARAQGSVAEVELDLAGLQVLELESGYDPDTDWAPGDDEDIEADVIIYDDMDPDGRSHVTWRLVSDAAVEAVTVSSVVGPIGRMVREARQAAM